MKIANESAHILSLSAQQTIQFAAANCGVDSVTAVHQYDNDDDQVYDIENENGDYLFSIETGDNTIFYKAAQSL